MNREEGLKITYDYFKKVLGKKLKAGGLQFDHATKINCVVLKEYLVNGQHCKRFSLLLMNKKHELVKKIQGTTIGHKRIITFPSTEVSFIGLMIDAQIGSTSVSEIGAYLIDEGLIEK